MTLNISEQDINSTSSKYRHELVNSLKKDLHVFAVGLGELRPAGLAVHHQRPSSQLRLFDEATL